MKRNEMVLALFKRAEMIADEIGLPIEIPDTKFDMPENGIYLAVRHMPNTPFDYGWGVGVKVEMGILQIEYVTPDQRGEVKASAVLSRVADAFPRGQELWEGETLVKIEASPQIGSGLQDGHKATYPVSIRYRCS